MRAAFMLLLLASAGCYQSHGTSRDADGGGDAGALDAGARDAGAACEISLQTFDGVNVHCTISPGSIEACTEVAVCICAARGPSTDVELIQCAGWDLTPRGAPTFTDVCTYDPPADRSLADALTRYLSFAGPPPAPRLSEACAEIPALLGPRPYDRCGFLAELLCPCGPEPCDLDALLGRPCLSLSRAQATCVSERLAGNATCEVDVPGAVRACGG